MTRIQRCFNVGQASATLAQHWSSAVSASRVFWRWSWWDFIIFWRELALLTGFVFCAGAAVIPGYGYLPQQAVTGGDRISAAAAAAAAAYYGAADYGALAATPGQMAASQMAASQMAASQMAAGIPRSEPSPLPLSTSPLHREQLHRAQAPTGMPPRPHLATEATKHSTLNYSDLTVNYVF